MKAIRFHAAIPRYATGLVLARVSRPLLWRGRACTVYEDIPPPKLPGPAWVRVHTRLGGICGSDLSAIHLRASLYYTAYTSFPYTFGHENIGTLAEVGAEARDWQVGERVVVEPTLWCAPRGFARSEWCPCCSRGEINLCQKITEGIIAPGLMTGICRDTGGSWSESFVAHPAQLYRVPDSVSDENALMVEPFCVGLHAALQHMPADDETVLVLGAGTIGLCTVAALRALGSRATILIAARYPFQREAALRLGASAVIGEDVYAEVARRTGAMLRRPRMGKQVMLGGAHRTFECVGSESALDDALRLTTNGGQVILVGVPGTPKEVDWTSIFVHELTVAAAYTYHHAEHWQGQTWRTFDLALHLMATEQVDLSWMVTHRFPLAEYDRAFRLLDLKGHSGVIKAVFEF
jgi:L-iditol 2-dehydrogenase